MMNQEIIIDAILEERRRQDRLHTWTRKTNRLAVMTEELGEIARRFRVKAALKKNWCSLQHVV